LLLGIDAKVPDNNPEATAAAFSEDGWFITGDLAYIDENGNLGLAGRKRDNVNINGVKFDLESLEAAIEEASFPTVLPSYTVLFSWRANGSESATESVVVVYIPTFGNDPSEDHLRYETSQNISRIIQAYCGTTPARILPLSTEALPKSSLGKLSRAKIRTAFETGKFAEFERVDQAALARHRETMFRAPSNHYEEAVRDAIAHISGVEPCRFSTASTLLEAGLTSMDLLMLKSDIERRLSLGSLPISMLVGGPTISKLAEDIADMVLHSSSGEYNPVVIFNKQNSAAQKTSPLWLLHPGAGEVLIYLQLTQYFPERAVYALRARGFDDGHPFWETYDEAVTSYADHVQRYQPTGPVVILGYSLGAAFAFGLAQRLQAQGREIQFLGLMNLPPDWQPALRTFNSAYAQLALGVFLDIVDEERIEVVFPDKSPEALSQMAELDVFDVVEKRFSRPLADLGISKAQFLHWAALALKLHHCVADRIPLGQVPSIDVFSAFPLAITRCTSTEEYTRKHLVLWQNHSVQPLRIHACEGRHYTMIDKENVASFQKTLKAAMRARGVF
jgi:thioesterase domain-containing protein/acyl carrier protein